MVVFRLVSMLAAAIVAAVSTFVSMLTPGVSSFALLFAFAFAFALLTPTVSASGIRLSAVAACSVALSFPLRLALGLPSSFWGLSHEACKSTFFVLVAVLVAAVIFV